MKLRLDGKSVRLRLRRSEVSEFANTGHISMETPFPGGRVLTVRLEAVGVPSPAVAFEADTVSVRLPSAAAREWADGGDVGIYSDAGGLAIVVEKEFRRTSMVSPVDADLYPNPRAPQQR